MLTILALTIAFGAQDLPEPDINRVRGEQAARCAAFASWAGMDNEEVLRLGRLAVAALREYYGDTDAVDTVFGESSIDFHIGRRVGHDWSRATAEVVTNATESRITASLVTHADNLYDQTNCRLLR